MDSRHKLGLWSLWSLCLPAHVCRGGLLSFAQQVGFPLLAANLDVSAFPDIDAWIDPATILGNFQPTEFRPSFDIKLDFGP